MHFIDWLLGESDTFRSLVLAVNHLNIQGEQIMASIQELKDSNAALRAVIADLKQAAIDERTEVQGKLDAHIAESQVLAAKVQELTDRINANPGTPVSEVQALVDELFSGMQENIADAQTLRDSIRNISEAIAAPAPVEEQPAPEQPPV